MKKYLLLFFFISKVLSENLTIINENSGRFFRSVSCGVVTKSSGFIVSGDKDVKRGDYPWSAVLIDSAKRVYFCGGSVISSNAILTAAHCIYNKHERQKLPREVQIMVGMFDLDDHLYDPDRQLLHCEEIFVHPRWHPFIKKYDADIAVLQTYGTIVFNDFVSPICLWSSELNFNGLKGVVVGYGQSEDKTKQFEGIPSKIELPTVSYEQCIARDPKFSEIASPNTFCAGVGDGRGVCHGDSGSGMILKQSNKFYVFGIVSSSFLNDDGFCDTTKFTVFTNVFKYLDWINNPSNDIPWKPFEQVLTLRPTKTQTKISEQDLTTCKSGQKFPFYLACDGNFDCADKSDETRCVKGKIEQRDGGVWITPPIFLTFEVSSTLLTFTPLDDTKIDDENFEISSNFNEKVQRFRLYFFFKNKNLLVKFLPNNLSKKFPNLIEIFIFNCAVKKINRNNLKGLHELKLLNLKYNEIEEIEENSFDDLKKLETLDLTWNKVKFLSPNLFDNLGNLGELWLKENNFGTLHENLFSKLNNLRTLSLWSTGLNNLDENLFQNLTKLENLNLNGNFISFLPPKLFWSLSELKYIDISSNQLKFLPENLFERNKKLEQILLRDNTLEKIPKEIFDGLSEIGSLDLRSNKCIDKNYDLFPNGEITQLKIDLQNNC